MEENEKVILLEGQQGRLDKILTELLIDESRASIQKMIQEGHVFVDGQLVKANYKLKGHETISYIVVDRPEMKLIAEKIDLDILFEDLDILILNKPQGLVVHPSTGHPQGTLVNGLLYYLKDNLSGISTSTIRPGIVHRLDKDTSGLIIIAKNDNVHQALVKQLVDNKVDRIYYAIVYGHLDIGRGMIDVPIRRDNNNRLRYAPDLEGKKARTHFQVVEEFSHYSLLECRLETGRTHQIRVHLEHIGHPILGDPIYQKNLIRNNYPIKDERQGQYLHAKQLSFLHPITQEKMFFDSPFPEKFTRMLDKITEL